MHNFRVKVIMSLLEL